MKNESENTPIRTPSATPQFSLFDEQEMENMEKESREIRIEREMSLQYLLDSVDPTKNGENDDLNESAEAQPTPHPANLLGQRMKKREDKSNKRKKRNKREKNNPMYKEEIPGSKPISDMTQISEEDDTPPLILSTSISEKATSAQIEEHNSQITEILERSSILLESISALYKASSANHETQKKQTEAIFASLSETENKALQVSERLDGILTLYDSEFEAVATLLKDNQDKIQANGGIVKPKKEGRFGVIRYFLYKYPLYKFKTTITQPWFKTFLLLILPVLLVLSMSINIKQHNQVRTLQMRNVELTQYEKKYWALKSLSAPGSKLEAYCDILDVYYADPIYYKQEIDSLNKVLWSKSQK